MKATHAHLSAARCVYGVPVRRVLGVPCPVYSLWSVVCGLWSVVVTTALEGDVVCGCDAKAGLGDRPVPGRGAYYLPGCYRFSLC
jgi:hypothetical protein